MYPVHEKMITDWLAAYKGGASKPTTRVTIQKLNVVFINYDMNLSSQNMNSKTLYGTGQFASLPFGQGSTPVELKNIKTCQWSRALNQMTASGNVSMTNTESLPVGVLNDDGEFERPGAYTFSRGDDAGNRWGYVKNSYNGLIQPDRIIRVYQGYGADYDSPPEQDDNLVCTFTGLIDTVTLGADKTLSIGFRDMGSVFQTHIWWPDVVPFSQYHQGFATYYEVEEQFSLASTGSWVRPKYETDSNKPYVGKGFRDGSRNYVDSNGGINGHLGKHAFDVDAKSYWLSVGNYPRWESAYEYVQGTFKQGTVNKVKFTAYEGPYTAYISLENTGDEWEGHHKIPYHDRAVDTHADVKFVKRVTVKRNETLVVNLPKAYNNIKRVRITLTDLWDSNIGEYQYRGGLKDVQVFKSSGVVTTSFVKVPYGNIKDYTGAIAWICGWAGFLWPNDASLMSFVTHADGTRVNYVHPGQESLLYPDGTRALPTGNIWGDLQWTGTSPIEDLDMKNFDKQPLATAIQSIKSIIGFNFFIDEVGGVIWRLPNIYTLGNYVSGATGGANAGYTTDYVTIDENETLLGMTVNISNVSSNERIFMSNTDGSKAVTKKGYIPPGADSGLRRYAGWTGYDSDNLSELTTMVDLIAQQKFMNYRQNSITIPGNPRIQIDDQVKIIEKVTAESYFHYVNAISSDFDASTGKWTYTLTTNWLGDTPGTLWVAKPGNMDPITQAYVNDILAINQHEESS